MKTWFKTNLEQSKYLLGTFDSASGEYNVTIASSNNNLPGDTISFNEVSKGWVSFKSFLPTVGVSLNNDYYTFAEGDIWKHHDNETRNQFYWAPSVPSTVTTVFGDTNGQVKSFNTINYEGSQARVTAFKDVTVDYLNNDYDSSGEVGSEGLTSTANVNDGEYFNLTAKKGWYMSSIKTDLQTAGETEFKEKEGKWFGVPSGDNTVSSTANFSTQGLGVATVSHSGSASGVVTVTLKNSSVGSNGTDWD
jgi:hypothetical protein